jgi:hypothetical protein
VQGDTEAAEIFKVFAYVNSILFDKLLPATQVGVATEVAKVLEYMMGQGLQYEVVRKRGGELKSLLPSQRLQDDSPLS